MIRLRNEIREFRTEKVYIRLSATHFDEEPPPARGLDWSGPLRRFLHGLVLQVAGQCDPQRLLCLEAATAQSGSTDPGDLAMLPNKG